MQHTSLRMIVSVNALLIGLIVTGALLYVTDRQQDVRSATVAEIGDREKTLAALAELTDRNEADETTARILSDCTERARFESLLIRLETIGPTELNEAARLFEACGGFYSEQKAVMVERMEREFAAYESFLAILAEIDEQAANQYPAKAWRSLISKEAARSALLSKQRELQGEIIDLLAAGNARDSAEVAARIAEAQETAQSLTVLGKQIDSERRQLIGV